MMYKNTRNGKVATSTSELGIENGDIIEKIDNMNTIKINNVEISKEEDLLLILK